MSFKATAQPSLKAERLCVKATSTEENPVQPVTSSDVVAGPKLPISETSAWKALQEHVSEIEET